jgi:hypothetical protein
MISGFRPGVRQILAKNNGKITNKMNNKCIYLFHANSLLHVSARLGHPQGDSQVVHYITAVYHCITRNLCVCVCARA